MGDLPGRDVLQLNFCRLLDWQIGPARSAKPSVQNSRTSPIALAMQIKNGLL
jgi:hypothetical protein